MVLLPVEMFDDGSIECKTFCFATEDDALVFEWDSIQKRFPEFVNQIREAIAAKKQYIGVQYNGQYCEFQWD
jgi:hypothetical protein